ncbi:hypothetical protein IAG41_07490 [Sphingomonas sp. JC676]|uniref:hypothetical protein n=1 Tax=Sphingomonas sp. JC676 TaxID=2768065 RepID=UPI0016584D4B|nr:hypothetical protein [Sphingomonas sp. JC676]MBC9032229.1 hypothetical protein [Sphingomonas sp. JC676]
MNVADLSLPGKDAMGVAITDLYARKPPVYGVYRTARGVMVHFADEDAAANAQRADLARLNPLRGQINGLVEGWRSSLAGSPQNARAERYDRRVGDALIVALEGDADTAQQLLTDIKQDILNERIGTGRVEYLATALATGLAVLLFVAIATLLGNYQGTSLALWRAAAAGTAGGFFSIALAIRSRTVLPDLQRWSNVIDAVLRMLIGTISGVVLIGLILSGLVTLTIGSAHFGPELLWINVLIAGFVAGFTERFVPDILEKATVSTDPPPMRPTVAEPAPAPAAEVAGEGEHVGATEPEADPLPEEAATDSCACDVDLPDDQVVQDSDLPAASGGVAKDAA